jgi:hypothetical protein
VNSGRISNMCTIIMDIGVGLGEGGLLSTKTTTNRLHTSRGDAPCTRPEI